MDKQKKIFIYIMLFVFVIFAASVFPNFIPKSNSKKDVVAADEFLDIYNFLLDKEFYTAEIEESMIVLKDRDLNKIAEYNLEKKIKTKLLYIQNRETSMIFWTSGFDDLQGIMFMKTEWTDEAWDGLARVNRLQGNVYKVYTFN